MQSMSSADFQPKPETPGSATNTSSSSKVNSTPSTIFNSVTETTVQELGGSRGDRPKKAMVLGKAGQAKKQTNSLTFEWLLLIIYLTSKFAKLATKLKWVVWRSTRSCLKLLGSYNLLYVSFDLFLSVNSFLFRSCFDKQMQTTLPRLRFMSYFEELTSYWKLNVITAKFYDSLQKIPALNFGTHHRR